MDLLTANDRPGAYPPSYYAASVRQLPPFAEAKGALKADVCVVGGGFTGLSTALHLAQKGYDVVLLEAQRVGFGASGRNGGQAACQMRRAQDEIEKLLGKEHARALWSLALDAAALVRRLCDDERVETPFHPGIIHADHKARFVKHSAEEARMLQDEYGFDQIRALDRDEIRTLVGSEAYYGGTLNLGAGHVDPLAFALGLARLAEAAGARIFEQSRVRGLDMGSPATLTTDAATIEAEHVVLACNGYLGDLDGDVAARVMPINNYVVATEPLSPERQETIIRNNYAVADSKFVVNYFRFSDDHRLLFGGTESYGYRFPRDIARNVRKPLAQIFPQLADVAITHAWGGTLAITMNRLPYFARLAGNVLNMSGFSGSGVSLGTLSGQLAAEAIAGQAERFDWLAKIPTPRFPGGARLRQPLLVAAMLWFSMRDRL